MRKIYKKFFQDEEWRMKWTVDLHFSSDYSGGKLYVPISSQCGNVSGWNSAESWTMNFINVHSWDEPLFLLHFFSFNTVDYSSCTRICRCKPNFPNILHLCRLKSFSLRAHYEFQGKFHKREMSKKVFDPSDSFYFDSEWIKENNWL